MRVGVFTEDKANLWGKTYSLWGLVTTFLSIWSIRRNATCLRSICWALSRWYWIMITLMLQPEFSLWSLLGICLILRCGSPCRAMRPLENHMCSSEFTLAPKGCVSSDMRERSERQCWCGKSILLGVTAFLVPMLVSRVVLRNSFNYSIPVVSTRGSFAPQGKFGNWKHFWLSQLGGASGICR